jgi:hypothetical protein
VETAAPPIQLFEPAFAHFLDDVANDIPLDREVAKATVRYMQAATGIYDTEDNRKKAIDLPFRQILGMGVSTVVNSDKTTPDGLIEVSLCGDTAESSALVVREDKRDMADGDASVQCGLSMARYWAQREVNILFSLLCIESDDLHSVSTQSCGIPPAAQHFSSPTLARGLQFLAPFSPTRWLFSV